MEGGHAMQARIPTDIPAVRQKTPAKAFRPASNPSAADAIMALQRRAGNAAVTALIQRTGRIPVQRGPDEVTIEDDPEEPVEDKTPKPIREDTSPLLLADKPWAEIETEQREKAQQQDARYQKKLEAIRPVAPAPGGFSSYRQARSAAVLGPALADMAAKQERIKQGYKALEPAKPTPKKLRSGFKNRKRRQLGPLLDPVPLDVRARTKRRSELAAITPGSVGQTVAGLEAAQAKAIADQAARPVAQPRLAELVPSAREALKQAEKRMLNTKNMKDLLDQAAIASREGSWSQVANMLEPLGDERSLLESYVDALDNEGKRITDLPAETPQKTKVHLRTVLYQAFYNEVRKSSRNDTKAAAALMTLRDAVQTEQDRVGALTAATQQAAQERTQARNEGRWPGNDKRAAIIQNATRATVGSNAGERAAVVEALDALRDPTLSHSWARKWGERHGNGEGNLPGVRGAGGYKEYYVRPAGSAVGAPGLQQAGVRRLVVNNTTGFVYYSHNHYGDPRGSNLPAFVKVTDA